MIQKTINCNLDQKEWEGLARVTERVLGEWCATPKAQDVGENFRFESDVILF
jgi:hypothetical protein